MKQKFIVTLGLTLVLASGLFACSPALEPQTPAGIVTDPVPTDTPVPSDTATPPAPAQAPGLTLDALRNASYPLEQAANGTISLVAGEFRQPAAEGSASEMVVELVVAAFGDLNEDGVEDAVVMLTVDAGGTGRFYYLYPVMAVDGQPVIGQPYLAGDRIRLLALVIADGKISLSMIQAGPNDPVCCPSQPTTTTYNVQDGKLSEVSQEILGSAIDAPGLLDVTWQWTAFQSMSDTGSLEIAQPENYTIKFLPDGSYQLQADCNRGGGSFQAQNSAVTILPGALTRMACPEGSQDTLFLNQLNDVVTYVIEDGKLYLNLKMDAGNMVFEAR